MENELKYFTFYINIVIIEDFLISQELVYFSQRKTTRSFYLCCNGSFLILATQKPHSFLSYSILKFSSVFSLHLIICSLSFSIYTNFHKNFKFYLPPMKVDDDFYYYFYSFWNFVLLSLSTSMLNYQNFYRFHLILIFILSNIWTLGCIYQF